MRERALWCPHDHSLTECPLCINHPGSLQPKKTHKEILKGRVKMKKIEITAYELAQRFVGMTEVAGKVSNPQILAMLQLDLSWPEQDEVAWCSAFVNYIAWLLRLPRSKSLLARSWLQVGVPIDPVEAEPGFDVVILKRGGENQPGPDVINAPGHVGFFAGGDKDIVLILGGNQSDSVNISRFFVQNILGIRRLF